MLLVLLAQFRYLEHQAAVRQEAKVPIQGRPYRMVVANTRLWPRNFFQARYINISNRIHAVDEQLHLLAEHFVEDNTFVHSNVTKNGKVRGPKMKTVKQLARATQLSIDVHRPCNNYGHGLTSVLGDI